MTAKLPEKYRAVLEESGCVIRTDLQNNIFLLLISHKYGLHSVAIEEKLKQSSSAVADCLNIFKACGLVKFEKVHFAMLVPGRSIKAPIISLKDDADFIDKDGIRQTFTKGSYIRRPKTGEFLINRNGFTIPIKENRSAGGAPSVTVYRIKEEILKKLLD